MERTELLHKVRERLATTREDPTPDLMATVLREECGGVLGDTDLLDALRYLEHELVGAGRLEPLLNDPMTTDILVSAPDQVWVDAGNGLALTGITFDDDDAVRRLACRLALVAGRRLDDAQPWVDAQLSRYRGAGSAGKDNLGVGRVNAVNIRLHAILPPLSQRGTSISLRVLRPATQTFSALNTSGAIPDDAATLLMQILEDREAFLVSGGTGAGKTTLLNALLGEVSRSQRIICVEDAPELAPNHPHVVSLIARPPNIDGAGHVTVRELVRQALRMRPDRIVVGEVRGAEVVDLLTALNTGHDGGAGTVHANSPSEVPARLEALAALGSLNREALHSQLNAAITVVLGVGRDKDGNRGLQTSARAKRAADGTVSFQPQWQRARLNPRVVI